jgi:galactosamine-6-phosphate isomerase
MQLNIFKNYNELSIHAAEKIIELVKNKPDAVLCLAAGDTPQLTYNLMTKQAIEEKIDFTQCTFIGLDEWVGIPPENEGSCRFFLKANIFDPLHISSSQIYLFDAMSENLDEECQAMDKIIREKGGIDLMLVGVGMNGHIGFNEPGVSVNNYSHVIDLDNATQSVGQKYFKHPTTLKKGITLGLNHLLQAREVIMVANGLKKAEVIRKALEEEVNTNIPASIIRTHSHGVVIIDEEAASLLNRQSSIANRQ